jgi:hypothetical protein
MCYSPCFMHATQNAFVQRQLLRCQTCGSQAFHVLDCCCNPNYVRVPTSSVCETLKSWFGAVQARLRGWLLRRYQRPAKPMSAEALDAWEARPIVINTSEASCALREAGIANVVEPSEHETVLSQR